METVKEITMEQAKYSVSDGEFIIANYNRAKSFASFFPAVSGVWGKPMWVYYVNRGQAVSSFGTKDKDGAMLEFTAANKAYRQTALQGFRTFIKTDGAFYEPFQNKAGVCRFPLPSEQVMRIKPHKVTLVDTNEGPGIQTTVEYCTLPNETFPALLRRLTIQNTGVKNLRLECLDGMPVVVPYGTPDWHLKNMSRLAEGLFGGVEYSPITKSPYYRLRTIPNDKPEIIPLNSANFYTGNAGDIPVHYFVDPDTVFGSVSDFTYPAVFLESGRQGFTANPNKQGKNKSPCAMGYFYTEIAAGEKVVYTSVAGYAQRIQNIDNYVKICGQAGFFETKEAENADLMKSICGAVQTKSSIPCFDSYCAQTFLDNHMRGGYPLAIGKTVFYAYSRVHGDMEREYNNFVVLPEYFSQGNGNYRDVLQNRRNDLFFNQDLGDGNIKFFMNLIQLDGFNPLKVSGVRFVLQNKDEFFAAARENTAGVSESFFDQLCGFIQHPVTIGGLFNFFEEHASAIKSKEQLLNVFIANSEEITLAEHGEGYWTDHWHYVIDLIDNFLAVFPDKCRELYFEHNEYTFYDDVYAVEKRRNKYVLFNGSPRQINAVYKDAGKESFIAARSQNPNVVRGDYGKGTVYKTNLFNKLLSLIANKYASLDPECRGVEMEADKPNWCDALNGLPGIFGSSTAETMELIRLIEMVIDALNSGPIDELPVMEETASLMRDLVCATKENAGDFVFWDTTHTVKEEYRDKTRFGVSGREIKMDKDEIHNGLCLFKQKLLAGLSKDEGLASHGLVACYFAYKPIQWEPLEDIYNRRGLPCIKIAAFERIDLPAFLEGAVHYGRLRHKLKSFKDIHASIIKSGLYDKKLGMLKLNESLLGQTQEIGRITLFTAGWLENESIWLHMEYKYMLELLRNGLEDEFFQLAQTAFIPFLDPAVYGRSIFENSSFLVSSAHPETDIHSQGFVSRLSGATAEFISMWIMMTCGEKPFFMQDGELAFRLQPHLSAAFFDKNDNSFSFLFLGKTTVVYHNPLFKNTFGNNGAAVRSYIITLDDGSREIIEVDVITGALVYAIRAGKVTLIEAALA
jgi:hypothetical protein